MEFDRTWKIARLNELVNAVMLAYWGRITPIGFAKADRNACLILDRIAAGSKVTEAKIGDALEWLAEAIKDDEKVMNQLGYTLKG